MTTTSDPAPSTSRRKALVFGVGGQDGAYLAQFLLRKGYAVVGTSRDASSMNRRGLRTLGIQDDIQIVSAALNDFRSVLQSIAKVAPDEIYNLAGQTSVGLSFEQPVETIESISIGTLNLLEAVRFVAPEIRLYNAGSSECFGDTGTMPATESTPFKPRSPYAVAKCCAHNLVANYRDAYQMFACTGVLFNHESPLRPERFVTQKIVRTAARIAHGSDETLTLGNLDIHRDWGWAPEYVEVMWQMLQQAQPDDYVIATGETVSLGRFVEQAFAYFQLDWNRYTHQDDSLLRPSDVRYGAADPSLAAQRLGWRAARRVGDVIAAMCRAADADCARIGAARTGSVDATATAATR